MTCGVAPFECQVKNPCVLVVVDDDGQKQIYGDTAPLEKLHERAEELLARVPAGELLDKGPFQAWMKSYEVNTSFWPARRMGKRHLVNALQAYFEHRGFDVTIYDVPQRQEYSRASDDADNLDMRLCVLRQQATNELELKCLDELFSTPIGDGI